MERTGRGISSRTGIFCAGYTYYTTIPPGWEGQKRKIQKRQPARDCLDAWKRFAYWALAIMAFSSAADLKPT